MKTLFLNACLFLASFTIAQIQSPKSITIGASALSQSGSGYHFSYNTGFVSEETPSFLKLRFLRGTYNEDVTPYEFEVTLSSIGIGYHRIFKNVLDIKGLTISGGIGANVMYEEVDDHTPLNAINYQDYTSINDATVTFGPNVAIEADLSLSKRLSTVVEFNNYYFLNPETDNYKFTVNFGLRYKFNSKKSKKAEALLKEVSAEIIEEENTIPSLMY